MILKQPREWKADEGESQDQSADADVKRFDGLLRLEMVDWRNALLWPVWREGETVISECVRDFQRERERESDFQRERFSERGSNESLTFRPSASPRICARRLPDTGTLSVV